jgi:hypothetical protein
LQRLVTARRDDAVTLTAHLRCTVVGQPGRIDNAGISLAGKVLTVTVQWIAIHAHMLRPGTVTRLAGNAKLNRLRL